MMKRTVRPRLIPLLLVISFALTIFSGCAQGASAADDAATLWVLTELSTSDGMNYQAQEAAKSFEREHEGLSVRIDILPVEEEEREIYLMQLRAQIMAGKGPDIYLLPTGNILTWDSPTNSSQIRITAPNKVVPLFQDVTQAMYTGIFADISSFYDADSTLDAGGLNQDIMDAGVVDGGRYLLPLRYNMPLVLTDPSNYDETGISQELIEGGIDDLAECALENHDTMMAIGLQMPDDTTLLPRLFDYENEKMLITKEDIADYMRIYQQWYAQAAVPGKQFIAEQLDELRRILDEEFHYAFDDVLLETHTTLSLDSFNDLNAYGNHGYHWSLNGFPLYTDRLTGALYQHAISRVLGKELAAQPMRSTDGSVIAEVTYYGAVGSGCKDPELAYEYLRKFLTADYQLDLVRPRAERVHIDPYNLPREVQVDGLVEDSWPVRTADSPEYLWDTMQYQNFPSSSTKRLKQLKSDALTPTNEDLPILDISIDDVRFPVHLAEEESFSYALALLNHADGTPTDVDIDDLAEQVHQNLWWHLVEG